MVGLNNVSIFFNVPFNIFSLFNHHHVLLWILKTSILSATQPQNTFTSATFMVDLSSLKISMFIYLANGSSRANDLNFSCPSLVFCCSVQISVTLKSSASHPLEIVELQSEFHKVGSSLGSLQVFVSGTTQS